MIHLAFDQERTLCWLPRTHVQAVTDNTPVTCDRCLDRMPKRRVLIGDQQQRLARQYDEIFGEESA